ncbi:MAG: hypothetical protein H3C64_09935 [Candidatus Kuenenia stuttgartiensis]|uniref:Uncharacterized protein n=1 Tax=Kuenenia stuttgartiensis TaxID=174633 RepID=A0A2C9CFV5_KUEST|nr:MULTISPECIES: hypothetical protein [Kuenenia]MBE7546262.1 hypothetical protein [Planctomycetia bacterium]MBW7942689.1 hypothetical protein [Candidatus Kuenenia stuttgartiensis]MBZ0193298.1 hypothetical protein [Candidatus Kuenenia stuttgartiensis]MCZ7623553.1 hypothetical protein [Candidatus Kuenenia sp.]SOH04478.1 hypothetical protein KSMBR1_1980 [Candidatus Kuenenia stuttgartiensis]
MMDTDQKLSITHIDTHDKAGGTAKQEIRIKLNIKRVVYENICIITDCRTEAFPK